MYLIALHGAKLSFSTNIRGIYSGFHSLALIAILYAVPKSFLNQCGEIPRIEYSLELRKRTRRQWREMR